MLSRPPTVDHSVLSAALRFPLLVIDADLRLRYFNAAAGELFALQREDEGRFIFELPIDIEIAPVREAVEHGTETLLEIPGANGRIFSAHIRPLAGNDGAAATAIVLVDVTELQYSREFANAIVGTVREPLLVLDRNLRVVAANAPFCTTFGVESDQMVGAFLFEIGGRQWNIPEFRAWLVSGEPFLRGLEVETDFGPAGRKTLSINARRIPETGPLRLLLIAIEDISARRAAERALRETHASFFAFVRDAFVGALETRPDGACVYINPQACRIIGVDYDQALGHGWLERIHPDDVSAFRAKLEQGRATHEGFSTELRFVAPNGGTTWVNMVLIPPAGANGSFNGYVVALTDITERKNLEDRLTQAQKLEAIGRLAGGVAHDFNNMLTALSGCAAQLLETVPAVHPARRQALQIENIVEQATAITRQLLAFSRKQLLRPRRVDVNEILTQMRDLLARLLGESIEISYSLSREKAIVVADRGQLQQVILNVAINARDAMAQGGRVSLSTSLAPLRGAEAQRVGLSEGDYVVLGVRDTGVGMNSVALTHLFEPFFTTKAAGAGTGLGLATVYGIVQQSGGGLSVQSEPGKGTFLKIYLPLSSGESEDPPPLGFSTDARGGETVLLVEDAALVRSLVTELLEQRGYKVLEAREPREALEICESYSAEIHLLLTDVVMPRMSGFDLAKKLRQQRRQIRVIFMSGYSGDALHSIQQEANFLEKPFNPETLAAFVRKVLDRPI